MPISKRAARFNKRVTNRVTRHFASWMPGFAIVSHVGRRSGRLYRTPVNVFRDGDRYVFALTYGADSDWVRNVLSAGGCEIETRRKTVELRDPKRFTDPTRRLIPIPARWILRLVDVKDFMALSPATATPVAPALGRGRASPRKTVTSKRKPVACRTLAAEPIQRSPSLYRRPPIRVPAGMLDSRPGSTPRPAVE
jgi:deazaflavin-dependent oxidoreductase (nitroreductase family)